MGGWIGVVDGAVGGGGGSCVSFRFVSRCCDAHDTGPGSRRRRTGFFAFAPKPILVIIIIILGLSVQCYMEFILSRVYTRTACPSSIVAFVGYKCGGGGWCWIKSESLMR